MHGYSLILTHCRLHVHPCITPGNLAHDEANKDTLMGCVPLVRAAMTTHGAVPFVQRQAVLLLWNLSFSDTNRALLRGDVALGTLVG